jgi:hypothetical protein
MTLWAAAVVGSAAAWIVKWQISADSPLILAAGVLPVYGLVYLGITVGAAVPEATALLARVPGLRKPRA